MERKLVLTGFMATGKSVVAERVARRLGWKLVDTDSALAAAAGKPVAAIFAEEGEARFRKLEREAIAALAAASGPAVVATGGGALVDNANFDALSQVGVIVCLVARPEVIARRVQLSAELRPKLLEGGKPLVQRIEELLALRASAYARAALTIDTSDLSVDEVVERVLKGFAERGGPTFSRGN